MTFAHIPIRTRAHRINRAFVAVIHAVAHTHGAARSCRAALSRDATISALPRHSAATAGATRSRRAATRIGTNIGSPGTVIVVGRAEWIERAAVHTSKCDGSAKPDDVCPRVAFHVVLVRANPLPNAHHRQPVR